MRTGTWKRKLGMEVGTIDAVPGHYEYIPTAFPVAPCCTATPLPLNFLLRDKGEIYKKILNSYLSPSIVVSLPVGTLIKNLVNAIKVTDRSMFL
jgi:hypothetical protein